MWKWDCKSASVECRFVPQIKIFSSSVKSEFVDERLRPSS